ncbi:MAG: PIN domain-containing protein [Alphaproteobacteria bacterium]|nr:PIN domain-containing protein [Alphaproteobacteria bacterium]
MIAAKSIAVDTSVFVSYMQQESGKDIELLRRYLDEGEAWFSPVVITELLSAQSLSHVDSELIKELPVLELEEGYWLRAGGSRRKLLQHKLKAKTADALIAQSCIDHNMPLLTRDADFKPYVKYCGLKLVKI